MYAACEIRSTSKYSEPEISYADPTFISIRSGRHDSSTACTHGYDFRACVEMEEFNTSLKVNDKLEPIAFLFVDGGPDENPRYPKKIDVYIQHFKDFDFDVLMVSTHAPGMFAYNYVERRMAPLSEELTGVVLPHDTFVFFPSNRWSTRKEEF